MSDYLWDKSGEPEEDVARLEELLGNLRFQPGKFEAHATLPSGARRASSVAARRAPRTFNSYSRSQLAIAASIILTLLAGAWLVASKRRAIDPTQAANGSSVPTVAITTQPTTMANGAAQPHDDRLAHSSTVNDGASPRGDQQQRVVVEQVRAPKPSSDQRREFNFVARKRRGAPPRQSTVRDGEAMQEQIATAVELTPTERAAMQKFMLAMRVTNEKLGYAERQVQGMNESSPQR
jgi:hypothetical protein